MTVKRDKWLVQPGTTHNTRAALYEFVPDAHNFARASNYEQADRKANRLSLIHI